MAVQLERTHRIAAHLTTATPQYKYTANHQLSSSSSAPVLTEAQRRFYEHNGYLVVRTLLSPEQLDVYRRRFVEICVSDAADVPISMQVMRDVTIKHVSRRGQGHVTKIQGFHDDTVLFRYCSEPAILRHVHAIIGPSVSAVHTMLIHKPPGVGASGRHPLHQDGFYFPFGPSHMVCCAWTAMERIGRENGGLAVLPGTHRRPLLAHGYPQGATWAASGVNSAYFGVMELTDDEFRSRVHLEMEEGDTVFFHPHLIHGSGANKSQRYRKAISCHYASNDCDYMDISTDISRVIVDEAEMIARKKGVRIAYNDIWRLKSRVVSSSGDGDDGGGGRFHAKPLEDIVVEAIDWQ